MDQEDQVQNDIENTAQKKKLDDFKVKDMKEAIENDPDLTATNQSNTDTLDDAYMKSLMRDSFNER